MRFPFLIEPLIHSAPNYFANVSPTEMRNYGITFYEFVRYVEKSAKRLTSFFLSSAKISIREILNFC